MTSFRFVAVLCAVVAALVAIPATASAAWTRVSEHDGSNTDEVGVVRGTDGVLHVAYRDSTSSLVNNLRYRTLSANGRTWSAPSTIVGPWVGLTNPDLEFVGSSLHAFWGGQGTTDSGDPTNTGQAWDATLGSGGWTRSATPLTFRQSPYASSQISSAVASDGTPWITWTGTSLLAVHAGLATGTADETNYSDGCCQYASNIARDAATGDLYMVWSSNVTNENGAYARRVAPELGDVTRLASAAGATATAGRSHRLAAASRTTGGVYSAYCDTYPSCSRLRVAGTSGPSLTLRLKRDALSEAVWTAAAPNGRMWLAWGDYDGKTWAVRSNKALTRWGAVRALGKVGASTTTWNLNADGSTGPLDVLLNATAPAGTFVFHQRVLPGLTLTRTSTTTDSMGRKVFTLRANDAGDAVAGAAVTLRGTRLTTNANGLVRFVVPTSSGARSSVATATKSGYAPGSVTLRVR